MIRSPHKRRLARRAWVLLGAALGALALLVFSRLPSRPPGASGTDGAVLRAPGRAVGVLHVHSAYSDGAGDVPAITRAAARAGLDFFVLTDHRDPEALGNEGEGYDQGVLRLIGAELSTDGGHVLALGIRSPAFRFGADPAEVLRDIAELGGFAIVAHPFAARPSFSWSGWDLTGFAGIELFNLYSGSRTQGLGSNVLSALVYPFAPRRALAGGLLWDETAFARWDGLSEQRSVAAWAGLDAHGRIPLPGGLELSWPGYEAVFGLARNHLVLEEPLDGDGEHDRRLVYDALRRGRGYVSFDGLADGSRFDFHVEAEGRSHPMGSEVRFVERGVRLRARVDAPPGSRLRMLRNGEVIAETEEEKIEREVDRPGIYRTEVWLAPRFVHSGREQPWIVSNPIAVLPSEELASRNAPHRPASSPRPLECTPLSGQLSFVPEHDPRSRIDERESDSPAPSFRIGFELGVPSAEQSYVWCAMADRSARDWRRFDAIRFVTRSDRVYRVDLQLRDENAGASSEGTEWWRASFKTAPEWKEVVVGFDELRSISPSSDGRLDLGELRGVFLVLDPGNTRPGVSGEIEIRDLALCRVPAAPAPGEQALRSGR